MIRKVRNALGAAGNVVNNLAALGVKVAVLGLIGKDANGWVMRQLMDTLQVDRTALFEVDDMLLPMLCESSQAVYEMAYISIYTGMRADEIFSLKWQDINLGSRTIFILETKNTESRTAYMTDGILDILSRKKKGLPHEYIFPQEIVRGATCKNGWRKVLPTTKKKEVSKTYFRIIDEIGLNDGVVDSRYRVCFHTLRHTFGSWLAIRGESLQTIGELMGHKRISQTMRYAHLCPDKKKLAVEGLHERD